MVQNEPINEPISDPIKSAPNNQKFGGLGTTLGQLPQQPITNYNKNTKHKPAFSAGLTRYNNL